MLRRPVALVVAASMTAGAALWVSQAALDLFSGPLGETRVAMLPPIAELAGLIVLSLIAGVGFYRWLAPDRRAVPQEVGDLFLPLFLLTTLGLPYLPWVADAVPLLRVLAGPGRKLVWFVILGQMAWMALTVVSHRRRVGRRAPARGAGDSRLATPAVVFFAGVLAFGIGAWRLTGGVLFPGGDEPHYLVLTQSLLRDHDLKIENNHTRGDYREYFHADLEPHYRTRGADGEIYSIHPIGLPMLAVPAFAVDGYRGVVVLLVLMAAGAAALMWAWARQVTQSPGAATFAWAAIALGAPFYFNSFTVYPEIPTALAVMAGIGVTSRTRPGLGAWLTRGVAAAALPWLSTKYAPMSAALLAFGLWRAWMSRSDARASWTPVAVQVGPYLVSLAAWFAFFAWIWGSPSPAAPYGGDSDTTLRTLLSGGPGLLFDQEYGVLIYAPALVVGMTGLWSMFRKGGGTRLLALEILACGGALWATVGAFDIWWGGSGMPGRPVASGLLLLGAPAAWQWARATDVPVRRVGHQVLLLFGLAVTATLLLVNDGFLLAQGRDGSSTLLEWLSPTWRLWSIAPSFIYHPPLIATLHAAVWILAIGLVAWAMQAAPAATPGRATALVLLSSATGLIAVSLVTPVLLGARAQPGISLDARDRVALLDDFDATRRPIGVEYNPVSRRPGSSIPPLMTLTASPGLRLTPQPTPVFLNARFALPAGDYEVRLRPVAGRTLAGTLGLQVGRLGAPMREWPVEGQPAEGWTASFSLPVDAQFVGFAASSELEASAAGFDIVPRRIVDAAIRPRVPVVLSARDYGTASVFFHDELTYPERTGFWTRGGASTLVTIAAHDATRRAIPITLRSGSQVNEVLLSTPRWQSQVAVSEGTATSVDVPSVAPIGVALVQLTSKGGFVPADLNATSNDRRFLGCWVEVPLLTRPGAEVR